MNVILSMKEPTVIAYENVFEEGDRWDKIQGCEACIELGNCCGRCSLKMEDGRCELRIDDHGNRMRYGCIKVPTPDRVWSKCALEFKCTKGSRVGEIIKVNGNGSSSTITN